MTSQEHTVILSRVIAYTLHFYARYVYLKFPLILIFNIYNWEHITVAVFCRLSLLLYHLIFNVLFNVNMLVLSILPSFHLSGGFLGIVSLGCFFLIIFAWCYKIDFISRMNRWNELIFFILAAIEES